jgi:RNA polymerase sigma-70 factor, ECF subfamily
MSAVNATPVTDVRRIPGIMSPIATPGPDLVSLMQLVQAGDDAAFASLYDELAGVVFGTVKRVLRDPAMSEEVTQEVFVELWRTAARFDPGRASVSTWAITIATTRGRSGAPRTVAARPDRAIGHAATGAGRLAGRRRWSPRSKPSG